MNIKLLQVTKLIWSFSNSYQCNFHVLIKRMHLHRLNEAVYLFHKAYTCHTWFNFSNTSSYMKPVIHNNISKIRKRMIMQKLSTINITKEENCYEQGRNMHSFLCLHLISWLFNYLEVLIVILQIWSYKSFFI